MRARRSLGPDSTFVLSIFVAIVVVGAALPARAADPVADPFAEAPPAKLPNAPQSNVAEPSQQAPASAPAGSGANFPTGLVERLPSSAYPEPVIRGLYGSSLWLDMQGHQWPTYPRIGVGISGYGWTDLQFKRTRIGDPGQPAHNTLLLAQGRFALRLTPTYTNGSWFVQAQAELIGNINQTETQQVVQTETQKVATQPNVIDTDDLWVRTGVWQKWDVTVGKFEAFPVYHLGMGLDLNTDERRGAYDGRGPGVVPQPYLASYLYYRPQLPANVALHLYPVPGLRLELLAQWGNDGITNSVGARPALIYDLGWVKFRFAGEYQWQFAPNPAPAPHNEYRNRGVAGSIQFVFAPWVEFGPELRPRHHRLLRRCLGPNGSGDGRDQQVGRHRELRRLSQLPSLRRHADRRRLQLRELHQPPPEHHHRRERPIDEHAVLRGASIPRPPPAVREGRRRLRQDPLRSRL